MSKDWWDHKAALCLQDENPTCSSRASTTVSDGHCGSVPLSSPLLAPLCTLSFLTRLFSLVYQHSSMKMHSHFDEETEVHPRNLSQEVKTRVDPATTSMQRYSCTSKLKLWFLPWKAFPVSMFGENGKFSKKKPEYLPPVSLPLVPHILKCLRLLQVGTVSTVSDEERQESTEAAEAL